MPTATAEELRRRLARREDHGHADGTGHVRRRQHADHRGHHDHLVRLLRAAANSDRGRHACPAQACLPRLKTSGPKGTRPGAAAKPRWPFPSVPPSEAEQVLIAAQRRVVVVRTLRVDAARPDPAGVEQHRSGPAAAGCVVQWLSNAAGSGGVRARLLVAARRCELGIRGFTSASSNVKTTSSEPLR